jgi:hypothetical protein
VHRPQEADTRPLQPWLAPLQKLTGLRGQPVADFERAILRIVRASLPRCVLSA